MGGEYHHGEGMGMITAGTGNILIVDDEPSIRETLGRLLSAHGYQTVVAPSGHEALGCVALQEFEVALLDMMMPGLSGLDTMRELLARIPDLSIIMITGVAEMETAVEAMKLGAYDYVTKPFNLNDLLVRVEKAREKRYLAVQMKGHQKDMEERIAQQAKDLRQMMNQTVNALIKEEVLQRELDIRGGKSKGLPQGVDLKEFGAKVLRRFSGSGT